MQLVIYLRYNLDTGKRVGREAFLWDPFDKVEVTSELTKQLLLPRVLPQEWLPSALRTGRSGPVRSWIDRSLFEEDQSDDPPGATA